MENKKKLAAISAVLSMISAEHPQKAADEIPSSKQTQWTTYGRQQTMSYRDLLQRRWVRKIR